MPRSRLLDDDFYDQQISRLSCLDKFPQIPAGQKELRHTLRRISDTDQKFLERLIGEVVDTHTACPKPLELVALAEKMRRPILKSLGNPDCEVCRGSGWESFRKLMELGGVEPYMADFARPCKCRR